MTAFARTSGKSLIKNRTASNVASTTRQLRTIYIRQKTKIRYQFTHQNEHEQPATTKHSTTTSSDRISRPTLNKQHIKFVVGFFNIDKRTKIIIKSARWEIRCIWCCICIRIIINSRCWIVVVIDVVCILLLLLLLRRIISRWWWCIIDIIVISCITLQIDIFFLDFEYKQNNFCYMSCSSTACRKINNNIDSFVYCKTREQNKQITTTSSKFKQPILFFKKKTHTHTIKTIKTIKITTKTQKKRVVRYHIGQTGFVWADDATLAFATALLIHRIL